MVIYKTTNLINGKIYIGKDCRNNPKYIGSGKLLRFAIIKYGKSNFKKEIIDTADTNKELCEKEIYWINIYNSTSRIIGYNITVGGEGGDTYANNPLIDKNRKFTDEHKQKISENHHDVNGKNNPMYGKCAYDIWVEKYGNTIANEKLQSAKEKQSLSHKERFTAEIRELYSNRAKGRKNSRYKNIIILQFSLTNEFIAEWPDYIALKEAGYNEKMISSVCRGNRKTANGYKWKFKNN
ncbi:MAG: GIY-YIG nuclease family protein [Candidatus Pacearchaeota archaeon]|jgi:hypothetical protein|nr:GIY-YIG nuclease family protein [Clostridia bacterium]